MTRKSLHDFNTNDTGYFVNISLHFIIKKERAKERAWLVQYTIHSVNTALLHNSTCVTFITT